MKNRRRGHAMVELAICATVMVSFLTGTVQFGYTFYVYNQLVTAVGNGARYASNRSYGPDVDKTNAAIRNMVVFGDPHPDPVAAPIVPNLKPENVDVKWTLDPSGTPQFVDVSVVNHRVNAIFGSFTFTGRPFSEFPYLGRAQ
jgi:TadE-like protein